MSDTDKLRELAETIMARLEDAHFTAMNIQGHDQSLVDMEIGCKILRTELRSIDNLLLNTNILMSILKSK